uniref:Chromobox homolog 2 (Drosophila Pc class) n=1 Tax=Cyclopterus lumpus TaxID=8103 RepID=A0A8C2WK37_CYCLU
MEELSAVGEQVFDAECILNKRLKKGKLEFLVKWRGWSSKEQEKELLMLKKGKRPRGRPRKILVSTTRSGPSLNLYSLHSFLISSSSSSSGSSSSSDSSSSCSSSSSSSDDDDDDDDDAAGSRVKPAPPGVRTRDLHPVPQKKAQIIVAKPEPPKKRSRKPPSPDAKDFQLLKGPRKLLKAPKDSDVPGAIKKPVHPASFTFMGFHRGSPRDAVATGHNRGPLTQGGAVKNSAGPGRSIQPASLSLNKAGQSRNVGAGKPPVSGGTSLDLKAATSKSKGVAALSLNTSKHLLQGATRHPLSSPDGQQRPPAPASTLQRIPNTKAVASVPPKNAPGTRSPGPQPLNLQSKRAQGADAPGNADAPASAPTRKPATPRVQGRLEKTGVPKASAEVQSQHERSAAKDGKKAKVNDMSTGEEESCSDSDQDSPSYVEQERSVAAQNQDWKPTRSLIEHVFVTDVTANLVTVTVKESPTSVGFFSIRNY